MSETRSDKFVTWFSLVFYAGTWLLFGKLELGALWPVALVPALAYCCGQAHEIRFKGHCYASADPTALPLALAATVLTAVCLKVIGRFPEHGLRSFAMLFVCSFVVGHLVAIVGSIVLTILCTFIPGPRQGG